MNLEELDVKKDRMRFTKNSFSANLTYLAILIDVFYFVDVYRCDVGTYFYNIVIGVSIVYNLIFMLAAFLSSEAVKNYDTRYSFVLGVLGVVQVIRIFIIPMNAVSATTMIGGEEVAVMGQGQFMYMSACLVISAVLLIVAAVVNYQKGTTLAAYMKSIGQGAAS